MTVDEIFTITTTTGRRPSPAKRFKIAIRIQIATVLRDYVYAARGSSHGCDNKPRLAGVEVETVAGILIIISFAATYVFELLPVVFPVTARARH